MRQSSERIINIGGIRIDTAARREITVNEGYGELRGGLNKVVAALTTTLYWRDT